MNSRESRTQKPGLGAAEARLFYSLASIAASRASFEDSIQSCLDIVCEYVGWPMGHLYLATSDGTGELAPTTIWHLDDPEKFQAFRIVTEETRFAPGVGLPGRVLSSGNAAWISDVQHDKNFPRNKLARDIGVRGAFGFPVNIGSQIVAVLEFFTHTKMEPDEHILEIMRMVGDQFGRILERQRAEQALREAHDELEKRVEERTEKLGKANEILRTEMSERERVDQQFRDLQEYLQLQIDRMPMAMIVWNRNFEVETWNPAAESIFGFTAKEALGKHPYDLIAPTDRPHIDNVMRRLLEGDMSAYSVNENINKDGHTIICDWSNTPLKEPDGTVTGVLSMVQDITESNKLQQQLIQADKLVAIGTLVSGVAHEVNNPLSGALGRVQLLLREDLDQSTKADLQVIDDEIQRAVRTLRNLLTFARDYPPTRAAISINDVIEKVLELRAFEMAGDNLLVDKNLQSDLPYLLADEHQLQQVFVNIVVNAEQAMTGANGRGLLSVKTFESGSSLVVIFKDDGPGIPQENLDRIFEPFFTTKDIGKGTGLGLSICYGIIQEHGGSMKVDSELGKGTSFTIKLPKASEP